MNPFQNLNLILQQNKKSLILMLIKNNSISILNNHIIDYPTPINLNYFWNFGSLAGICLVIQILTSIFLVIHYSVNNTFKQYIL